MAKNKIGEIIDRYSDEAITLQEMSSQIAKLGYLMVPRLGPPSGSSEKELVAEVGNNKEMAGRLGLPPGSGLLLATNQLPEAVVSALCNNETHDPLAPNRHDKYGWLPYNGNDGPGALPWVSGELQTTMQTDRDIYGRLIFVPGGSFAERGDSPGHFFVGAHQIEGHDRVTVTGANLLAMASDGLVAWRNPPAGKPVGAPPAEA